MNKVLIVTNVAFLLIIAYLLLHEPEAPIPTEESICKDYSTEPLDGIDFNAATTLFGNYAYQYSKIGKLPDSVTQDAQSVWFDLITLKKFLYKIEDTLLKQKAAVSAKDLGIRIYYGSYPKRSVIEDTLSAFYGLPADYEDHHTVFMIPTFNDAADNKIHHDFNPWYPELNATTKLPTATKDLLAAELEKSNKDQKEPNEFSKVKTTAGILAVGGQIFVKNHGQIIPPPAPTEAQGVSLIR
jgi:hypothetical protein